MVGRHFHFILLKYFTQKLFFSQKFPLIQNSFVAIHNKMFRAGAKTLVGSGNLKHISGLDMHWYWRTRQAFPFKRKLYFPLGFEGRIWDLIVLVPDHCLSFHLVYFEITNTILRLVVNFRSLGFQYRNEFYFYGFYRCVNSAETFTMSKARRLYVKIVSDSAEFTHRYHPQKY